MTEILNSQPKNSAKVYDPKVLDFKGYCESLYGRPPESHFITVEKHLVSFTINHTGKKKEAT